MAVEMQERPVVEGSDLPFKLPVASLRDLELPQKVEDNAKEANGGSPSLLEAYAGPIIMAGRDLVLIGAAPNGKEQVSPLLLPLVARLVLAGRCKPPMKPAVRKAADGTSCEPQSLVLTPTRELASYATESARTLLQGTRLRVASACGGTAIEATVAECASGIDLLVATPGCLLDLLDRGAISVGAVKHLLLVAADAIFDAGFEEHVRRLILDEGLPSILERQTTFSCALMAPAVTRVTEHLLRPNHVKLTAPKPWLAAATVPHARQTVRFADDHAKQAALAALLMQAGLSASATATCVPLSPHHRIDPRGLTPALSSGLTLVVVGTKRHCDTILYFLQGKGFSVGALPNDRPKRAEKEALMASFASGKTRILVATDVALRMLGEELCPVAHVVSFDFPGTMLDYVQRLSYTARGGHTGRTTTLVTDTTPKEQLKKLAELLLHTGNEVPRWFDGMAQGALVEVQ